MHISRTRAIKILISRGQKTDRQIPRYGIDSWQPLMPVFYQFATDITPHWRKGPRLPLHKINKVVYHMISVIWRGQRSLTVFDNVYDSSKQLSQIAKKSTMSSNRTCSARQDLPATNFCSKIGKIWVLYSYHLKWGTWNFSWTCQQALVRGLRQELLRIRIGGNSRNCRDLIKKYLEAALATCFQISGVELGKQEQCSHDV